jgi:hypothetical protein
MFLWRMLGGDADDLCPTETLRERSEAIGAHQNGWKFGRLVLSLG